ncbi:histone-lysine n-methyltransferase suv9 [Penicillium atrosanguineum]|uniref:FAD binding domain protein n=1 Tax=Penicillium atrosanguineum TaxID=1132637 RepID=A0A9W9UEH8_9EURO|nr:histone-lysine n-methyltransferase suv9 [Penicillium atrosanguineum]KAJ5314115.1 histone-lysine n-methyltransferase suv9 [Penicillium atrosanguineum]KAJ5331280.1 FAD binding domain protein [Penicillium atrosanguineum]
MLSCQTLKRGLIFGLLAIASRVGASQKHNCNCFPGDECWPSVSTWNAFNESISGRLIKTVPLAIPCHAPYYDENKCEILRNGWNKTYEHYQSSSSIMAPFFTNGTCDPFHPVSKPCTFGNLVHYAVNISQPEHVSMAIRFATKHHIRFIIRNTGHDYNGKSTGAGALAVWMHNLKDIEIKDYNDKHYQGKSAKLGAGVQGIEAYRAADAHGLRILSGACPSVGIAGGYSQGGGHSMLSSRYGLGADQVLEWEVIDGTGRFLVATREQNSDLYWALSGGGGGTYGVVWSMTSKAHQGGPVSGLNLTILTENNSDDLIYKALELYNSQLPAIVDEGIMSMGSISNTSFQISPMTAPDIPVKKLEIIIQPLRDGLDKLGVRYTWHSEQFESYLDEFDAMMRSVTVGVAQYGSWLIPRSVVQEKNDDLTDAIRQVVSNGGKISLNGMSVSKNVSGDVYNAVLPAWRDAITHAYLKTTWKFNKPKEMLSNQNKMTRDFVPRLQKLAPQSGAYLNEADFRQPNWKAAFYGENYKALRQIKAKYDPHSIFYGVTAVGSDEWIVSPSGRMCRA